MKITFLGTSHGAPEKNRRCTSTLVEAGENRYLIDLGTDTIAELVCREIDIKSVKAVFVTHMHGDHTHGLMSFADLCGWYYKSSNPKIYVPCDVDRIKTVIGDWFSINGSTIKENIEFSEVTEGTVYDDGILKVTAFKTMHCHNSYAYLLECENKRVVFTGDLNHHPEKDFPMSVFEKPLDLCVCECAHFEATSYLPIFEDKDCKKLYIHHIYPPRLASVDAVKDKLCATVATDGMVIEL